MPLPRWVARFNLYVTSRLLGPLATRLPGMGVVLHTGCKTHRKYRTPVLVFRRGDKFTIALTYGPKSEWVLNALAQGGCELQTQGRIVRVSHPRLFHDEQRRAVPAFVRFVLGLLNVADFLELAVVN